MANLKSVKKNICNKLNNELIPKMIDECFKLKSKKKPHASFMCWLNENRSTFEICTVCNVKLTTNNDNKKICPKCNAKIKATSVASLGGKVWRTISDDVKQ